MPVTEITQKQIRPKRTKMITFDSSESIFNLYSLKNNEIKIEVKLSCLFSEFFFVLFLQAQLVSSFLFLMLFLLFYVLENQ
jgi:hypothetical protein